MRRNKLINIVGGAVAFSAVAVAFAVSDDAVTFAVVLDAVAFAIGAFSVVIIFVTIFDSIFSIKETDDRIFSIGSDFNQKEFEKNENYYLFEKQNIRMINQILSLRGRGRANLGFGILIAIIGVGFLGWTVLGVSSEQNNDALMTQFVPKVTLTILTEIFALFFLRLYSNGLVEIKYWQNEITNLELKRIAYNGAMKESELNNLQTKIIESFAATERNFVLNKNQTTVELEKEKLHRQDISDLAAIIKNNNKAK
jgi:hypothetical protein